MASKPVPREQSPRAGASTEGLWEGHCPSLIWWWCYLEVHCERTGTVTLSAFSSSQLNTFSLSLQFTKSSRNHRNQTDRAKSLPTGRQFYKIRTRGSPEGALTRKGNVLVTQSCPSLCNPTDCSPPGSSIHGTLQARILEWVAISFSRGASQPRDQSRFPTLQVDSSLSEPPGMVKSR